MHIFLRKFKHFVTHFGGSITCNSSCPREGCDGECYLFEDHDDGHRYSCGHN